MPFRKGARITVTNETAKVQPNIFYDINYSLLESWDENNLYFHAHWRRDTATQPGMDYLLLPKVAGHGRFMGINVGVNSNADYKQLWWGEGEVNVYLDGDGELPTLVGTGTEDYIGSAWFQGEYANRFQGCLEANKATDEWAFYRYHVPDPIFFHEDIRVTIEVIGGGMKNDVLDLYESTDGPPVQPISIGWATHDNLLDTVVTDYRSLKHGWMNFYRSDDFSSTAYFYLDRPTNDLPPLADVGLRTYRLRAANGGR